MGPKVEITLKLFPLSKKFGNIHSSSPTADQTMVCFLACFGLTKKQRRRKPRNKTQPTDQGRYVPLDSGKPEEPDSETRNDDYASKESLAVKVKKKVSFNLNVKTYEPLQQEEIDADLSDGEEKLKWEYPSDYRYYNCRESFDEDDEIELEESDLEDDIDDYDGDDEDNHHMLKQAEFSKQFATVPMKTENIAAVSGEDEPKSRIVLSDSCESNRNTRNRSQYVNSVLNPVENLTQWKAVKARERTQVKNQKENIRVEQEDQKPAIAKSTSDPLALNCKHNLSDFKVDASLSNWLISSENKPPPGAVSLQKWASC